MSRQNPEKKGGETKMDIMTLMMGSTPQASVLTPAGSIGTVDEASAKTPLFATLLETSMQLEMPGVSQDSDAVESNPATALNEIMAQLSEPAEVSSGHNPANPTVFMSQQEQTLSVFKLLKGLKNSLNDSGTEGTFLVNEKLTSEDVDLASEILNMVDQNGQYAQVFKGAPKPNAGTLKTAAQSIIEGLVNQTDASKIGKDADGASLATLMAAMTSLLPGQQDNSQSVNADAELQGPGNFVFQPVAAREKQSVTVVEPASIHSELTELTNLKNLVATTDTGSKKADEVIDSEERKTETLSFEIQNKTISIKSLTSQSPPEPIQTPIPEELQNAAATLPEMDLEISIDGEAGISNSLEKMDLKQESVTLKADEQKSVTFFALPVDEKTAQVTLDANTVKEPAALLSREQIALQVREKIAEHRITQDNGQVTIRLNPADLGELKISVKMENQRLHVEIVAENRTVKDALMDNIGSLKEALAKQNMEMKQFDVSTGSRQFFNQGFREGRQQEHAAFAQRQNAWLTGGSNETDQVSKTSWQPRDNALLDMMM